MAEAVESPASGEINPELIEDVPPLSEQANDEGDEETPAETVTLTKAELQEQKNAVAKKERERSERKASREIQALRAEFESLKTAPVREVPQGKPTLDKFDSYDEFTEALTDWKIEQREQIRDQSNNERQAENQRRELQKSFAEKTEKFREATPDYDDVISEISDVELSPAMIEAVIDSDVAAQLTYFFGKNPDELDRINELSPIRLAREIGRLEAQLANKPTKQSNAPQPITPVTTRSSDSGLSDNLSAEEWIKRRTAQLKRK